jgi:uncharacterized protein (DUF305 family)
MERNSTSNEVNSTDQSTESEHEFLNRVSQQLTSRRGFMNDATKVGAGAIALSAGTGVAAANDEDTSEKAADDVSDLDVLNYALTLEKLEATFYTEALERFSENEIERSEIAAQFANPSIRYSTYQRFETIRDHEQAHVETLTEAIKEAGGTPVSGLTFEFSYETVEEFVGLARVLEDTGTAAYAGVAEFIDNPEYLAAAAQILAVEARHASYLRVLDNPLPFGSGALNPFPKAFNTTLTMQQVTERIKPFIVSGANMETDLNLNHADVTFLRMMIPHHKSAVAMAKLVFGRTAHQKLAELAEQIIATQKAEIEYMKQLLRRAGKATTASEDTGGMMMDSGMMSRLKQLEGTKFDIRFMKMMIEHHQRAIEMSQQVIENGQSAVVEELARNIIEAQRAEIEQMRTWIRKWS